MKPTAVVGAVSSAGVRARNPCFHFPCFLSSASVSETSQMGALTHRRSGLPRQHKFTATSGQCPPLMLYTFTLWPAHGQGAAFVLLRGPRAHPGTQAGIPQTSLRTLGQLESRPGSPALMLSCLGATDAPTGTPRPSESSAHSFWSQTPAQRKGFWGRKATWSLSPLGELKPRGFWDP